MQNTELLSLYKMSNQSLRDLAARIECELHTREVEKEQHEDAINASLCEAIEGNYGVIFTVFYNNGDTDVFRLDKNTHYLVEVERNGSD